jgi:hypothetical protein
MSSTSLEVVFEGPAVKSGTIDARLLAESLLGYSEVFTRANAIVNGGESQASVLVQSEFKAGSFIAGLELVQNISEQAAHLITAHQFLGAGSLAGVIGFLPEFGKEFIKDLAKETVIGLYKWLKGKRPDEVKSAGNEGIELRSGQDSKTVNVNVFNLYGDSAIRAGLDKLTSPLRDAEIDKITVRQDDKEQAVFEKSEAGYFEAEPIRLQSDAEPMEGEREAVLVVSKLSFKQGSTWTFFERGATIVAKIEDEDFWERVHKHDLTFGEGDLLKVRLTWNIHERHHELKQKNTIVKVLEKLERPKQMRLDGRTDDDPVAKLPKGRKVVFDD